MLEIEGKNFEGKCTFKFDRLADKKYSEKDKDGNDTGGFMTIYMNLLQFNNKYLLAFWDCALEYLGKDKPTIEQIEAALEARIEEDEDTEPICKEAFKAVDESGFFKKQAKKFWKDFELMKDFGKSDEEKAENKKAYDHLLASLEDMKA